MTPQSLTNPIAAGFNPDPSAVRVGEEYFLVTSTFEYLPGIPIYRSTDLESWDQIGNVIERPGQLDLSTCPVPGGVWAPTLRFHAGRFHLIVTVMFTGHGCLYFTADDPAGPWSDPKTLEGITGIDPDLAWDDDGTAYVTFAFLGSGILQAAVDLEAGTLLEEPRVIWGEGWATEGPHLYRRENDWLLIVAEGGTERGHAVSAARGPSIRGPFRADPENPVLTARGTHDAVQNVGHADLVDTMDGRTVAVALGVRPVGFTRSFSPLGRESFITEVDWVDGWPRPRRIELADPVSEGFTTTFEVDALDDPGWIALRHQPSEVARVDPSRGLVITSRSRSLNDPSSAFVGRRQPGHDVVVSTLVDAATGIGGLAARHSDELWFSLEASRVGDSTEITARASLAGIAHTWTAVAPGPKVRLRMNFSAPPAPAAGVLITGGDRIRLVATGADGVDHQLCELDGRYWSFETSESFTGRVLGLFAVDGEVSFRDFRMDIPPTD